MAKNITNKSLLNLVDTKKLGKQSGVTIKKEPPKARGLRKKKRVT